VTAILTEKCSSMSDINFMLKFSTKVILFQQIVSPAVSVLWRVTLELCPATNVKSTLLSDFNKNWNVSIYFLYNSYRAFSYNT